MSKKFSYQEFTTGNLGLVTEAEQQRIRFARVLVLGLGGIGGACLQALARAGVEQFAIADSNVIEVANLNHQVFATLDTIGVGKVKAAEAQLKRINPDIQLKKLGDDWTNRLDDVLPSYKFVINDIDDVAASIWLYRKAREHGATVIDAYTSPLPSVIVVRPTDPRPEERLGYPTQGMEWKKISEETKQVCVGIEIEYVLVNSTSARYVDPNAAKDLVSGKGKRISLAPTIITSGNMMAFETLKLILDIKPVADSRGYFFNPWHMQVEKPRSPVTSFFLRHLTRQILKKVLGA